MARGKTLTPEQLKVAADLLAKGESKSAVSRAISVSDRAIRRWLADAESPLSRAVANRGNELERVQHLHERRSAATQGLPAPLHPRARREQVAALEEAEQQAQQPQRVAHAPEPTLTEEQSADVAFQRFLGETEEAIQRMIATRTLPSRHGYGASSGFALRPGSGAVRQGVFAALPTQAEQGGFYSDTGAPAWATTDPFAGMYGR